MDVMRNAGITCPICAEKIGDLLVLVLSPNVIVASDNLSTVLALLNLFGAHIVMHHTSGLTDESLSALYLILENQGLEADFETWKALYNGVDSDTPA